jgi:hypothetical protein
MKSFEFQVSSFELQSKCQAARINLRPQSPRPLGEGQGEGFT